DSELPSNAPQRACYALVISAGERQVHVGCMRQRLEQAVEALLPAETAEECDERSALQHPADAWMKLRAIGVDLEVDPIRDHDDRGYWKPKVVTEPRRFSPFERRRDVQSCGIAEGAPFDGLKPQTLSKEAAPAQQVEHQHAARREKEGHSRDGGLSSSGRCQP